MSSPSLIELGQVFARLKLPPTTPGRPLYLHPVRSLWSTAQSALDAKDLTVERFKDEADLQQCLRTNQAWAIQTHLSAQDPEARFASHTVAGLLGRWHGGSEQTLAATLFQEYFSTFHLCLNDHIEAGFDLSEFLNSPQVKAGFCGNEQEIATCLEHQEVWTMVNYAHSDTTCASSSLEGLLQRAWEHHPVLSKATQLEATLGPAANKPLRPRM